MTRLASPVKLIAAILYRDEEPFQEALRSLEEMFSRTDYRSAPVSFEGTRYYESEMGSGLLRVLLSFENLVDPVFLVPAKLAARDIEDDSRQEGKRRVNIDMGYLDHHKMVLASFKERGNKVYLERGVWADMTLFFRKGSVDPLPWSFPDFKAGLYDRALLDIRMVYQEQMRSLR
jgi:hypothetical protein